MIETLKRKCVAFPVKSTAIKFMKQPSEFYSNLMVILSILNFRVGLGMQNIAFCCLLFTLVGTT